MFIILLSIYIQLVLSRVVENRSPVRFACKSIEESLIARVEFFDPSVARGFPRTIFSPPRPAKKARLRAAILLRSARRLGTTISYGRVLFPAATTYTVRFFQRT